MHERLHICSSADFTMIRRRDADSGKITKVVDLNQSDPAMIAPTIAHIPRPSTKEIAARRS